MRNLNFISSWSGYFLPLLLVTLINSSAWAQEIKVTLSKSIYNVMPVTDMYSEQGAMVANINYAPVAAVRAQLEERFGLKLKHRGEAHITVITPPESQGENGREGVGRFMPAKEMLELYGDRMQKASFEIACVGKQHSSDGKKLVFFLVVKSPEIFRIREEIASEIERRGAEVNTLNAFNFYPHITIGFVGGDVHGVAKDTTTCLTDVDFQVVE